jgi:hypothetical protein
MDDPRNDLILFLRLAQAYRNRLRMSDRDRALVLAGTLATMMQMPAIANFCRQLVLQNNHGHMLRKWASFAEALKHEDFGTYLAQVRRKLPTERAETLLSELQYECDVRREDYPTDEAYAAAVMGVDVDWVNENFG